MEVLGKIEKSLYWEWRTTIEELSNSKVILENSTLRMQLMEKEIELMRLRTALYRMNDLTSKKEKVDLRTKEYSDMKDRIEKDCNVELKNCVIDDITFEIKRLDSEK